MNEDDKFKNLNSEVFSGNRSNKELFYYFRMICKTFFVIMFKKTFSRENKEKVQKAFKDSYLDLKNFFLVIMKFLFNFIVTTKKYIVRASKNIYAMTFSKRNKRISRNLLDSSKENSIKGMHFLWVKTDNLYKKAFSDKNRKMFNDNLALVKDKTGIAYKRLFPNKVKKSKVIAVSLIGLILLFTLPLIVLYSRLPNISEIKYYHPDQSTEITDINNVILTKVYNEENRIVVPIKDLPPYVSNAVVSMEDERFYKHKGVDLKGISRAFVSMIVPNNNLVKSGGSTITQQLARNIYLNNKRTLGRKVNEMLLAMKIENELPKERILEVYLNEVYWGHGAYGIEAASKTYFGKSAKELSLAEASVLGGLLSSPETYSPYKDMKKAKWRQSLTLENMVKNNYISETDAQIAQRMPLKLNNTLTPKKFKMFAPYFSSYVLSILGEKYGDNILKKGGLKVKTTIDLKMQQIAENTMATEISKLKKYNINQGALISIEPKTGFIKALVGGKDYETSQFNRVTQALRQPGSAFKPFVYLEGFRQGLITPNTYIKDSKVVYNNGDISWTPQNYDKRYAGNITVKQAIKTSNNNVAVKVAQKAGIMKVINTAHKLGIESTLTPNLTLALGTSEVSPLNMAEAYSVFANNGKKTETITPILEVEDRNKNIIEDFSHPVLKEVYSPEAIKKLNTCLKEVVSKGGTGYAANIKGLNMFGKTGTTSENKDSWFIGYTPELVTIVWLGNDNNSKMFNATGGRFCAPIWKKYMTNVLNKDKIMLAKVDEAEEQAEEKIQEKTLQSSNNNIASISLTNNVPQALKKKSGNKPYYVIYVDKDTFEKMAKKSHKNKHKKH